MADVATLRVNIDSRGARAGASQVNRALDSMQSRARRALRGIETANERLRRSLFSLKSAFVALGAGLALREGVRSFREIERNLAQMRGLVGLTNTEVQALSSQFSRISRETARSQVELSRAAFFVTSAGLRGQAALDVLEQAARSATAGLGETDTVVRALTAAVSTYGQDVLSAAQATDVLTASVRAGAFEAGELAPTLGRILPIARAAGVEFHEIGAAVAFLSRSGQPVPDIITSLRGAIQSILAPSSEARKFAEGLGVSLDKLRETMGRDMLQAFRDLHRELGGNVEAIKRVLGRDEALLAVLGLVEAKVEAVNQVFRDVEKSTGVAAEAFKEAADTADHKLNVALETTRNILIALAGKVLPPAVDWFTKLAAAMAAVEGGLRTENVLRAEIERVDALIKERTGAGFFFGESTIPMLRRRRESLQRDLEATLMAQDFARPPRLGGAAGGAAGAGTPDLANTAADAIVEATKDQAQAIEDAVRDKLREPFDPGFRAGGADIFRGPDLDAPLAATDAINEALRAQAAVLREQVEPAFVKVEREIENARRLLQHGLITPAEFEAFKASLSTLDEVLAGISTDTEKVSADMQDLAHVIGTAFEDAVLGGEKFRDVLRALVQDISRIGLRMFITKPLESALTSAFSGGGDFLSSIFGGGPSSVAPDFFGGRGGVGPLPAGARLVEGLPWLHAQHGLDFTIPGSGGTDSVLVPIRGTPGERVKVTPQGEAAGEAGGDAVTVNVGTINVGGERTLTDNQARWTAEQSLARAFKQAMQAHRRNN